MIPSEYFNWIIAILFSLTLYSTLFIQRDVRLRAGSLAVTQMPLITRLNFNHTTDALPDVLPAVKKTQPERINKQPERINKIRKKSVAIKKSQPEHIHEIRRKPVLVKKYQPSGKRKSVRQTALQPQTQGKRVSLSSENTLQQKRQQYLQKLLRHIEAFKYYPQSARMRSIEGVIKVTFVLNSDGSYKQLILDGKYSVLIHATRMALKAAAPLPIPDDNLELLKHIEFTMLYSLTQ